MIALGLAIVLATFGQVLLSQHDLRGLIPDGLAILLLLVALQQAARPGGSGADIPQYSATQTPPNGTRWPHRFLRWLLLALALTNATLAFLAASNNTYRWYGVIAWLLALALFLAIFWRREASPPLWQKLDFKRDGWRLKWTTLAVIGLILIGAWFRFWRLPQMPPEMTSDHIEKLLDVHDLVNGQRPIFFVRNTGREPWQFYWTLMFIRLFDLETKFTALKLGTAAVGLLMLPGVYLLGRDLFGRWVGLWATLFAAVASWPVILSRIGLRFPFAPAATAWSLLYLLRGLRSGRRSDFLLLGLWLGIGLHGYTAFRAMPLVVVVCWALSLVFRPSSLKVRPISLLHNALLTILIAVVVFIPLGRFSLEHPDDFWRRSASRIVDPNRSPLDDPATSFLNNLWNLALMFHWKGDDVWVNTLADAPVLDPLLGSLFLLGLVIVLWRGLCLRDPIAPLLLVGGAILLLPSALSLAYPVENPSVVRTGGAIPAVMIIAALPVGLGMEQGLSVLRLKRQETQLGIAGLRLGKWQRALFVLGAVLLALTAIVINYRRYFVDYWEQYQRNALNTTEIASAIHGFIESGGDPANAWIIAWPYWIDTRGVGIELGDPPWNNVILETEELEAHADRSMAVSPESDGALTGRPRFYVLHPEDTERLALLHSLFPNGWSSLYTSQHPDRGFVLFYVPRLPIRGWSQELKGLAVNAP